MDAEITRKILALLDRHRIMTMATLRPDGWPQATTVGYASEGFTAVWIARRRQISRKTIACRSRSITIRRK